jgi:hypothetical protein
LADGAEAPVRQPAAAAGSGCGYALAATEVIVLRPSSTAAVAGVAAGILEQSFSSMQAKE